MCTNKNININRVQPLNDEYSTNDKIHLQSLNKPYLIIIDNKINLHLSRQQQASTAQDWDQILYSSMSEILGEEVISGPLH